jgi:hypothetical protein
MILASCEATRTITRVGVWASEASGLAVRRAAARKAAVPE